MNAGPVASPPMAPATDQADRLKAAASRLEGVFVNVMFQAMRATVPQGGAVSTGAGEEIFTSLFDQELADRTSAQWNRGLGSAIVRAFAPHAAAPASPTVPSPMTPEHR